MMSIKSILSTTLPLKSGGEIACLTLNKPKALNALDLEMINELTKCLIYWKNKEEIKAIFIDSAGDKAFCAGGDIVSMYKSMTANKLTSEGDVPEFIAQFFTQEYRLDYLIHTYNKPIIAWGDGIIMGGGLGLFAGASNKIVTEKSRVAMPEITIGLFPDVGASYFLNQMPPGVGKFLGLTGCSITAADAVEIGLADQIVHSSQKESFIQALLLLEKLDITEINSLCESLRAKDVFSEPVKAKLSPFIGRLAPLQKIENANDALTFIKALATELPDNKVLNSAYQNMRNGSAVSVHLVMQQLQRSMDMSLAECFRMELSMAYQCSMTGEFLEGVRALLIDKDNQPKWRYSTILDVPCEFVEEHFSRFVNAEKTHPLANLEYEYGANYAK